MSLQKYRSDIDAIDDEIIQLLEKRKTCVIEIGKLKRKTIWVKEREEEIVNRLKSQSKNYSIGKLI